MLDHLNNPKGEWLVKNANKAISNVVKIINNFEHEKIRW